MRAGYAEHRGALPEPQALLAPWRGLHWVAVGTVWAWGCPGHCRASVQCLVLLSPRDLGLSFPAGVGGGCSSAEQVAVTFSASLRPWHPNFCARPVPSGGSALGLGWG